MSDLVIVNERRQKTLIAVVCFGAFMANLDSTIVNVCLPTIASEMKLSPSVASIIVLAYLLFETGPLMAFGKLGDLYGGRPIFLLGFSVFSVSSFACGMAPSFWTLVLTRAIQGMGGAMMFSVMLSFAAIYIPAHQRGRAVGYTTMAAASGVALGPTVGGFLAHYLGWRNIFFINVPLGIAAIAIGLLILPKEHPEPKETRFDLLGAIYQTLFLLLLILGFNKGLELGWTSLPIVSAFAGALLVAGLFIHHEKRIDYPIINFKLLASRNTLYATISLCLSMMVFGGILFLMPFYLQDVSNLKSNIIGLIMSVISFGQFLGPLAGHLGDKKGHRNIVLIGVSLGLVAFIMFAIMDFGQPLWWIILALTLFGLSQGLNRAPNIQLVMANVPAEWKGSAASLTSLMRSLGLVLGIVIFETILSEFIPSSISIESLHLKGSGVDPSVLHEGFMVAFAGGILISLIMILLIASIRTKPAVK